MARVGESRRACGILVGKPEGERPLPRSERRLEKTVKANVLLRCRTAGYKSVTGRSCDRPPRLRVFLVSMCLKANADMVPKTPSCHYMLLMWPSRSKLKN
jgi:hypothetical protein